MRPPKLWPETITKDANRQTEFEKVKIIYNFLFVLAFINHLKSVQRTNLIQQIKDSRTSKKEILHYLERKFLVPQFVWQTVRCLWQLLHSSLPLCADCCRDCRCPPKTRSALLRDEFPANKKNPECWKEIRTVKVWNGKSHCTLWHRHYDI